MQNNITKKRIKKSCTLCGTCYAICPKNAISFNNEKEEVVVNENLCINCGLCIRNCPTQNKVTKKETLLGDIYGVYVGYSNDKEIRFKSASGGILTQTLKYLIENNIVDKVLITDFEKDIFQADAYFTDNIDKIINASGSKYQIVNINKELKDLLKNNHRIAYVGLPCHHKGLEQFIKTNPQIKSKIMYKFAICCSHNCNIQILDYITYQLNIKKEDITSIKYRGNGWPEYLTITTKNENKIKFPVKDWNALFLSFFYTPKQCLNCTDFCGETSDISFADAWLEEYTSQNSDGYNLIFSHNEKSEELLQNMATNKQLTLIKHSTKDIIKSQIIGLFYKKHLKYTQEKTLHILKTIIKFNSTISKYSLFKFVKPIVLRYYFHIINIIFIKKQIKKYKDKLLHEHSNC